MIANKIMQRIDNMTMEEFAEFAYEYSKVGAVADEEFQEVIRRATTTGKKVKERREEIVKELNSGKRYPNNSYITGGDNLRVVETASGVIYTVSD